MNRRKFLSLLSLTSTSYFFAPIGGWHSDVIVQQRIEYIRLRPGALHDARWWPITHRDGTVSYATQATEYITPENYAISSPWTPELYVSRCHQPGIEFRLAPGEAERWRKEAVLYSKGILSENFNPVREAWQRPWPGTNGSAVRIHIPEPNPKNLET